MAKKVVLFFAQGTEECEALLAVDLLRRAGAEVTIAAIGEELTVTSSHGVSIVADALATSLDYDAFDMLVLPGGVPGTPNLAASETVQDAITLFMQAEKWVAAICAAPSILGARGFLDGKHATAHAAFQDQLGAAIVQDEEVVVDGKMITSYGLGGAIPFALVLVEALYGAEQREKIATAIAYRHTVKTF